MALRVYNTLTRKKEAFEPGQPGKVGMYVCGPTVYKPSHIGHMVGPVIFDTIKRYLEYLGYRVTFVVNITDVDDKLIVRARELGTGVKELAEKMTADYQECLRRLNVTGIDCMPRATEHIGDMIEIIGTLVKEGKAYAAGGDVYFDITQDEDYGKLCNRDPEQLEAGARIEISERKRNPGDFALWKGAKPGEPQWDSPWGPGRPGWHIECSAMSMKYLGRTLDIHGGGLDLQFPHHENELAQSESYTGQPFARYWLHNGLLRMGKSKMAGSVGNVLNVADVLQKVSGEVLRFFLIGTHYRSPIDLGDFDPKVHDVPGGLMAARKAYEAFAHFAERYQRVTGKKFLDLAAPVKYIEGRVWKQNEFGQFLERFRDHMDDDFNSGGAVGVLFELVTALNRRADAGKLETPGSADPKGRAAFEEGTMLLKEMGQVLGLFFEEAKTGAGGNEALVNGLVQLLIDLRAEARKNKNFAQGDLIRDRLAGLGITLEDRKGGTGWRLG